MEIYEYKKMYEFESKYWWYRSLRSFLAEHLSQMQLERDKVKVLDAGCGTGGNLQLLSSMGFEDLHGTDFSPEAVEFCKTRGLKNVVVGDLNNLPFSDNTFDFILCSNVFESEEVNESKAIQELRRVLKPGGKLVIIVAAFQFLLSEHDRAVHCIRRYDRSSARKAFGLDVASFDLRYLFFFVFPLLAIHRLLTKFSSSQTPQSDVGRLPSPIIGNFLFLLTKFEVWISKFVSLPFGSSLMIKIQKPLGGSS